MKRLARWAPLLHGIAATSALADAGELPTSPTRRDAHLLASEGHAGLEGIFSYHRSVEGVPLEGLQQTEKRQADIPQSLQLTPAQLAELLTELQVVYGQLSAFSAASDTGLLHNLLRGLSGVLAPLSDVLESVRVFLVGDSETILDQLAVAQALASGLPPRLLLLDLC